MRNGEGGTIPYNERGHLLLGGCDAVELARQYGTPLYVFDEGRIRAMCREYVESFAREYPDSEVVYAGKAFLTTAMCRLVEQEGLGLDVASGGELYTALAAEFPPQKLYFHGNNKSPDELTAAVAAGVGRVIVDNFYELELLDGIAGREGRPVDVLLRITPGVEAHTHAYIKTGQLDSKFGFPVAGDVALSAVSAALAKRNVRLRGFHCHIGSQILDLTSFEVAVEMMFEFMQEVRRRTGYIADDLNMGGGLGIRYHAGDRPPRPSDYARVLAAAVKNACQAAEYPAPRLLVEPGRSIVGEAGTTLYTVGAIKEIPGVRTYVAVDGGMADNPRVALYGAKYEAIVANKADREPTQIVSVAGKCCESGDMLIWDAVLAPVEPGDILAVYSTGAYNYSMASNYNRLPRPAVVFVRDGESTLIVRRETYADLIRLDVMPEAWARSPHGAGAQRR